MYHRCGVRRRAQKISTKRASFPTVQCPEDPPPKKRRERTIDLRPQHSWWSRGAMHLCISKLAVYSSYIAIYSSYSLQLQYYSRSTVASVATTLHVMLQHWAVLLAGHANKVTFKKGKSLSRVRSITFFQVLC